MRDIQKTIRTYHAISILAAVYRHNNVVFDKTRRENVAEHSYSLATLGCAIAHELNRAEKVLDIGKVAQFAIVHDLVEAYMDEGDISVYASKKLLDSKKESEEKAIEKLEKATDSYPWIADTIREYESQRTLEAKFIYALDKIVVHMNIILNDHHHVRPTFERYVESEKVARAKIAGAYARLLPYFDDLCQIFRERPHFFKSKKKGKKMDEREIIEKVKTLHLPLGQYVVFGSGPLMVHGIRESRDIDLLVTSELYETLKTDPSWEVKTWPSGGEYLANGDYEVDNIWHYNDYKPRTEDIIAQAEIIDGIPFAPLSEVLKWKRAFGRPKDLTDVKLIEAYLGDIVAIA